MNIRINAEKSFDKVHRDLQRIILKQSILHDTSFNSHISVYIESLRIRKN